METSASVWSMMSVPPDLSGTLVSKTYSISRSMPNLSKIGICSA